MLLAEPPSLLSAWLMEGILQEIMNMSENSILHVISYEDLNIFMPYWISDE
jgi:hypothetical protein